MAILATLLAILGYMVRTANRPYPADVLTTAFAELFPEGTPREAIEEWVNNQDHVDAILSQYDSIYFRHIGRDQDQKPLDMAGLRRKDVSYVLRVNYSMPSNLVQAYFFFDHNDKLIKFWIKGVNFFL